MNRQPNARGIAGLLAIITACAACCALPLLGVVGLGTGIAAGITPTKVATVFAITSVVLLIGLAALKVRSRMKQSGCSTQCAADRSCCEEGEEAKNDRT